jgi:gamma-glutamyl phosphate reductase
LHAKEKIMLASAEAIAQTAKAAFEASQLVRTTERTLALREIRKELEANKDGILKANSEDMAVRFRFFISVGRPPL